ncbi:putative CWC26-like pre-mRNA-splicing factor [Chloropicon primus]|nr:putative CWC26-like pre-mRNA-splicing factor [Chloropicon primus]
MEAYLSARYGDEGASKKRRKKKRRKGKETASSGFLVQDGTHGIPLSSAEAVAGGDEEEGPVVVNGEEVERERERKNRLSVIRSKQRWQTVSTGKEVGPPAGEKEAQGGSRSRSPSPPARRHDSDDSDGDGSDDDMDVSRRRRERYDSPDSSDMEVERRGRGSGSSGDDSDSDMDVRRRGREPESSDSEDGDARGDGRRMTDGTSTGLVTAKVLKEELEQKRVLKEKKFEAMGDKASGRSAETVYRDRATGARVSAEELAKREKEQEQRHTKPMWSSGLAQKQRKMQQIRDTYGGAGSPPPSFDYESDQRQKEILDPMAHLVSKKKKERERLEEDYIGRYGVSFEELQKQGYVIPEGVPQHSWLKRGVRCPENRFGIRPGAHWDGVDRSNGFEKDYFKEMNRKRQRDRQAFMWGQEDM